MIADKEICARRTVRSEGLSAKPGDGLSPKNLADALERSQAKNKIGIETWDRFPAPLFLGLRDRLPNAVFERSTIVEELRMVKSALEVAIFRNAARVGDRAHKVFRNRLMNGIGKTELELIREVEYLLRSEDPIYEDSCSHSPALISTGTPVDGSLLNLPSSVKSRTPLNYNTVGCDSPMKHQ